MPPLGQMPRIVLPRGRLKAFGKQWIANGERLSKSPPYSSLQFGKMVDDVVANAIAVMLGGIKVVSPKKASDLLPPEPNCVEVGNVRVIGGVRPQNFDVGYRPDGVRFAFDSKTLNDAKSIGKNYQNMINDLGTEAATVHTRFPYGVVAFMVLVPGPCLGDAQRVGLENTLERLAQRRRVDDDPHLAESIALVVWDPATGAVDDEVPRQGSPLRLESFSEQVQSAYFPRYRLMPPHAD